jgi:DNA replication and repair protein RecF
MTGMQILSISLENFRNLELTRLTFEPGIPQFFVGSNGQGKSNLLEALGLITAVRSFRTHELSPLIQKGKRRARILYEVEHSPSERMEVSIELGSKERAIEVDGVPEPRLSAFVGRFPAVVFSTDDIQLVKGSPQGRRRFFDLLFSVADPRYLQILQSYHRTLRERNMALKQSMNHAVIAAFDHPLARWGAALISARQEGVASFTQLFNDRYLGSQEKPRKVGLRFVPPSNRWTRMPIENRSPLLSKETLSWEPPPSDPIGMTIRFSLRIVPPAPTVPMGSSAHWHSH